MGHSGLVFRAWGPWGFEVFGPSVVDVFVLGFRGRGVFFFFVGVALASQVSGGAEGGGLKRVESARPVLLSLVPLASQKETRNPKPQTRVSSQP